MPFLQTAVFDDLYFTHEVQLVNTIANFCEIHILLF